MNLALFFEGTGQGVHGKKTNVSLVYENCLTAASNSPQLCHLENGPGAKAGSWLLGGAAGVGWRVIFARARRWFEANYKSRHEVEVEDADGNVSLQLQLPTATKIFLFGFSRGALLARHFAAWLDKLGVEVEYLGLWDTVDAIPDLEVSESCPPNVKRARHAVAEHEARRFFAYVPLKPSGGCSVVEEELFPGCHSDVGGLYEDDHLLADLAREWVVAPALAAGLLYSTSTSTSTSTSPSPSTPDSLTAHRHDSQRLVSNLWGLLKPVRRVFPVTVKRHFESYF